MTVGWRRRLVLVRWMRRIRLTSSALAVRVGSQIPRVSRFPAYPVSAAPEVVDLASRAGLVLDPWQRYVLERGLGQSLDGQWTARKVSCWVPRQNGKGGIIEALELAWLFLPGLEQEQVIHSAHQHRTAMKAYVRMKRLVRNVPWLHRRVRQYRDTNGEQMLELRDGRTLEYSTRSGKAVRGYTAPKIVLDEAQYLTEEHNAAITPATSAMPNLQLWYFGTPPTDPTAWAYDLREDGEAGTPRLAHFDWGAELDLSDPDAVKAAQADLGLAYACNPAAGIRILEETIVDEARPSGLGEKYPMERLGAWLPRLRKGGGAISAEAWAALADPGSRRSGDVAFAVDMNPRRTHTSIALWGRRADGRGHAELVEYRPGTAWVAPRCAELRARHDPVVFVVDERGPAGSLVEHLAGVGITRAENPAWPHRGCLVAPSSAEMAAACGQLLDAVSNGEFAHYPRQELTRAAEGAAVKAVGEAAGFGRRASDVDIAPLVAVTLARWAFEQARRVPSGGPNLW